MYWNLCSRLQVIPNDHSFLSRFLKSYASSSFFLSFSFLSWKSPNHTEHLMKRWISMKFVKISCCLILVWIESFQIVEKSGLESKYSLSSACVCVRFLSHLFCSPFLLPSTLSDEFGKLCYTDNDCTDLYGTGQCDLVANRCTGVRLEMELGFLGCLLEDVDSVTRSAITNELERAGTFSSSNIGKKATAELLRNYLVQDMECASDYGPMSEYRSRFVAESLTAPERQLCPVVSIFFQFFSFSFLFSIPSPPVFSHAFFFLHFTQFVSSS